MDIYRLIEVDGVISPADGLVDKIIATLDDKDPKLVVIAGVAGSGKTLTAKAVTDKLIADDKVYPANVHTLSSLNKKEAESIEYAKKNLTFSDDVDSDRPMKVVVWDEVRCSPDETATITRLLNIGYCVIALAQTTGHYSDSTEYVLKNNTEFNLA